MSAADVLEIATPDSDFLVTQGDACHRTDNNSGANHCLTTQTDATYINVYSLLLLFYF